MAESRLPAAEAIPGTPRIREVRIESESVPESTRRGGLRPGINISPPFESDQKTVTESSGRGSSWVPFKLADNYSHLGREQDLLYVFVGLFILRKGVGEFDIKRMEENAAKLEKDLIMKELETLDFLESLGSTKKIVKDLKLELRQHPVRCMDSPEHLPSQIKEMIDERSARKSPDMIFMELKQVSMNLGKTMNDLAMIQSYVESLNMETEEQKDFLGPASLAEELNSLRSDEDVKMFVETNDTAFHRQNNNTCLKTAEMRLIVARKMEEAARAAEALAIAEMTILSTGKNQEPPRSPLTLKAQMKEDLSTEIMRKLEEANEEVKQSQQALETALNRVEITNVKQLEAEDAFRQWNIESWKDQKAVRAKSPMKCGNVPRRSFLSHLNQYEAVIDLPKPVLKRNVGLYHR